MIDRVGFFNEIRDSLFNGSMSQKQVDGCEALMAATEGLPVTYRAYILATAYLETASTMLPIAEYGKGRGHKYGKKGKYGQAQYGRGYVQLTWDHNYIRADKELNLDGALLADFNLAMQPTVAANIIVKGMLGGWFTGEKLSDYLPNDYRQARRIVNGMDRAGDIAGYAEVFERAFIALGVVDKPKPSIWKIIMGLFK